MEELKKILGEGFGERVLDYMRELASGLGVAVEHVYYILVRQQIVWGITTMIGFGIGILLSVLVLRWVWKNPDKHDDEGVIVTVGTILPVGMIIVFTIVFFNGFMHVFNPEYYAIKMILESIK